MSGTPDPAFCAGERPNDFTDFELIIVWKLKRN
jgi:hypothetical protein